MSVGRVLLIIFGSLFLLVALAVLVGSGALFWVNSQKDSEGYFTTNSRHFQTDSTAITADDIEVVMNFPARWTGSGLDIKVKVVGENNQPGKGVFIGLAPSSNMQRYLSGAEYDEIDRVTYTPFKVDYQRHSGTATPAAPGSQTFWTASAQGTGAQTLEWDVKTGTWALAVMNADASRGVDVDLSVGATIPFVLPIAIALLVFGLLLTVLGGFMVYLGARTPRRPPEAQPVAR